MTHRSRKPSPPDADTVTIGSDPWETLWAEILPEDVPVGPPPGEGWKTVAELAEEKEKSRQTVDQQLRQAYVAGTVERVKCRVGAHGSITYFYRPTSVKNDFSRKGPRATR